MEAQSLTYDANDRLTTDIYDANGNTTAGHLMQSAPVVNDAYDFEDRLINRNSGQVVIKYDGDGNRVNLGLRHWAVLQEVLTHGRRL